MLFSIHWDPLPSAQGEVRTSKVDVGSGWSRSVLHTVWIPTFILMANIPIPILVAGAEEEGEATVGTLL